MSKKREYRDRSVFIHGKYHTEKWDFNYHIIPPITTSVSFRTDTTARGAQGFQQFANPDLDRSNTKPIYIYSRLDEPCMSFLEETLTYAERGETAVSFATGMGAVSAVIGVHVKAGDHILMHKVVYGCTYTLVTDWFKRFGVEYTLVDFTNINAVKKAIKPNTKVAYFETPCNPTLELIDIEKVANLINEVNQSRKKTEKVVTIVDNTFATPFCQRPLTLGVDFVLHSLTKNLGGFGADMGGAVIGPRKKETDLLMFRKDFGAALAPEPAWNVFVYGMPTLFLRLEKQQKNAMQVAQYLDLHPKIKKVSYPGLESFSQYDLAQKQMRDPDGNFAPGSLLYFEIDGATQEESYNNAVKFIDHIGKNALSITLAVSLGQVRSLIEHPSSMTHALVPLEKQVEGGISPGGVRLSVGIEDPRDLLADIEAAISTI